MTAVARRRTAWLFLAAALILASLSDCTIWERTVPAHAATVATPTAPMRCGSVPGGEYCTTGYLPGSPQARAVAAALLEMRVTRSARGGTP